MVPLTARKYWTSDGLVSITMTNTDISLWEVNTDEVRLCINILPSATWNASLNAWAWKRSKKPITEFTPSAFGYHA